MRFDPTLEGENGEPRDVHFLWAPHTFEEDLIGAGGARRIQYDLSMLPPGEWEARARSLFCSVFVERDLFDPEVPTRMPTVEVERLRWPSKCGPGAIRPAAPGNPMADPFEPRL